MKTLSPPDNISVYIYFTIDPVGVVKTKLRNIIEKNYGFKVKDTSTTLKITLTTSPNRLKGLINRVNAMFKGIEQYDVKVCLEYYVKLRESTCICSKPFRFGDKAFCIEDLGDGRLIHIYCNERRKETTIRFFRIKPSGALDTVLIPKSLFIECSDAKGVVNTLNERVLENVALLMGKLTGR